MRATARRCVVQDLAVVAVAADRQARGRPVASDAAHQAAQMPAHLLARRRPAWTQQDHDRPGGLDVVDVDGQEAALATVAVEQRELLVAMHHVARCRRYLTSRRQAAWRSWRNGRRPWCASVRSPRAGWARSPSATRWAAMAGRARCRAGARRRASGPGRCASDRGRRWCLSLKSGWVQASTADQTAPFTLRAAGPRR